MERLERRDSPSHMIGDHIHPILEIEIEGELITIPADIGITPTRTYHPHTHDTTGTLHIGEGPESGLDPPGSAPRYTTLKDFFDVWRTTNVGLPTNNPDAFFSSTQLLNRVADATHAVFMTVNGQSSHAYETYSPHDEDLIVLSYRAVVNRQPVAHAQTVDVVQGESVSITLSGDDGNPEGVVQTLRYLVQSLPAHGTLRAAGGAIVSAGALLDSPQLSYTPGPGFTGMDAFTFLVKDDGGTAGGGVDTSDPAMVTMHVTDSGANQPPVAMAANHRVAAGGSLTFRLEGDDGDSAAMQVLSYRVQTLPSNGVLLNSHGETVTAGATLPDPALTYVPAASFTGIDSFTFNVADDGSGRTGGPLTSIHSAEIRLSVEQQADPAGVVYVDYNDNGLREEGEPGIPGVLIELYGVDDAGSAVYQWQRTAADGTYRFDQLWPGVYEVHQTQPAGYLDGKDTLGTLGGSVENDRFSNIALGPGDIGEGYNFGERPITG